MTELGTMCPIEYYKRIHSHGNDTNGLPELFDYGQNDIYTWLLEESFLHTPTLGDLCNIFNLTPSAKRYVQDFALKHTFNSTPLLNNDFTNDTAPQQYSMGIPGYRHIDRHYQP